MNELISEWTIPFILLTKYYIYRSWWKRSLSRAALWPSSGHAPHHWARSPWKQEDKPLHYHFLMTLYLSGTVEFIIQIPRIQFQHLHRPLFPSALRMCSMLQMCTSLGQGVAIWKTKYRAWTSGTSKISTGMHRRPLCGARVRDSDRRLGFTSSDTKLWVYEF